MRKRKRIMTLVAAIAMVSSLSVGTAAAAPTNARNYDAIAADCELAGPIVIELTNVGQWGTGKVQGTQLTGIPRWFEFSATDLDTGEVLFTERVEKRNATVDDVCTFTFVEEVGEGDPQLPPGTYEFRITVGVKVVGP